MMVFRGSPTVAIGGVGTSEVGIFPAENCVWEDAIASSTGNGYTIEQVHYFTPNAGEGTTSVTNGVTINDAVLGYIGKSGRFVATTEAS